MLDRRFRFYLMPDTGSGGGGEDTQPEDSGKDDGETEAMRKELEELRKEKAERERKAEEERKAKMTEDEKAKAELDKERASLLDQHRKLQLEAAGLDEGYAPLITGSTSDEIRKNGELVKKLIEKVQAETEARVKKEMAKTGAPGSGGKDDAPVSDEDYYKTILNGGKD